MEKTTDDEMEVDDDRVLQLRRLVVEGRLGEVGREVFGKGVLEMLDSGESPYSTSLFPS